MNYYETLYIIHPALESGRLKDLIIDIEDSLKKMGGAPLAVNLWGKRKLAYFIDKQKYGTYVLVQYNGEGKCTRDFAVELEHNPNILAYLTTNIDHEDVIEQEKDLDTQIAGKTREDEKDTLAIKNNDNNKSKISVVEKQNGNSVEVIKNDEGVESKEDDQQTDPNIENEKEGMVQENIVKSQIDAGDDEQLTKIENSKTIDENKSTEENIPEEKAVKSAANNEKE